MSSSATKLKDNTEQDRRQHKRVPMTLLGRYMLPDKQEFPCQLRNLSAGGMSILCPETGEIGDHVIAYINDIGRVEGIVVRVEEHGAAISFTISQGRRQKIVERLTWLMSGKSMGVPDTRDHKRVRPEKPETHFILPDGRSYPCEVIDISLSGASIKVSVLPGVGTPVTLGKMRGTIVRVFETGVAIEFDDAVYTGTLSDHFG